MDAAAMPVNPPTDLTARHVPEYLTDEDVLDLATFFEIEPEDARERVETYRSSELAQLWHRLQPQTGDELVAFYAGTDLVVWELMQWHASASRGQYWAALTYVLEHYPPSRFSRVLDFGAGVGTDALFLASHGYNVTLVDVPGVTFDFARHRFKRHGLQAHFKESLGPVPVVDDVFDISICFDVLEHLPDPSEAIGRIIAATRPDGAIVQQASFGYRDEHPCHLHDATHEYSGLRWHIRLCRFGLRNESPMVYRRLSGLARLTQLARVAFWRMTGLWLVQVPR